MSLSDMGDAIDRTVFDQILEMDDEDEDREFSKSIVFGFFEQAEQTFTDMHDALYVDPPAYLCFPSSSAADMTILTEKPRTWRNSHP